MEKIEIALITMTLLAIGLAVSFFLRLSNLLPIVVILSLLPGILMTYIEHRRIKEIERMFPYFATDVTEVVRAGMPLTQAIKYVAKNDYGELSKHVRRIAAKLDMGIPLSRALESFAKETKSKMIGRAISTIIKVDEYGGRIVDVLSSVIDSIRVIDKLKRERELLIYGSITQCYAIFLIFLGIMVAMYKFLFPMLTSEAGTVETLIGIQYSTLFLHLSLIQAFFSGIVIGKMTEGSVVAGLKHSLILLVVSYLVAMFLR